MLRSISVFSFIETRSCDATCPISPSHTLRLGLEVADFIDLLGTGTRRVKLVAEPFLGQSAGQLQPNHALAHAQNLGVVAEHASLHAEAVVGCHGADSLDLVRGNGNTEARSAYEERAVGFALRHETSGCRGAQRVSCLVCVFFGADIDDFADAAIGFKVSLDGVFV